MSLRPDREEALAQIVRELREQAAPELDWQRIEARLMAEVAKERAPAPAPERSHRLAWAGLALAAAAAAALLFAARPSSAPRVEAQAPPAPSAPALASAVNGDKLTLSEPVTAGDQATTVEHAGRARWTLDPHSSAALSENGEHLTVALLSGALEARVTPSQKPETFAVEVGKTRFAVHGTAFRVQRSGDRVTLTVSEGVVAVEPVGTRDSAEFLLRARSRGEFAFDGRTGKVEGNASVVSSNGSTSQHAVLRPRPAAAKPGGAPGPSARPAASVAPASEPVALPEQLSIADVEAGVSRAVEIVNGCFHKETEATGIAVVARTGMTLHVTPEGEIDNVSFGPALAPEVEACAAEGLRSVAFARSVQGASFTRILELSK